MDIAKKQRTVNWEAIDRQVELCGVDVGFQYRHTGDGNSAQALLSIDNADMAQNFDAWTGEDVDTQRRYGDAKQVNLLITGEWEAQAVIRGMRWWIEKLISRYGDPDCNGLDDDGDRYDGEPVLGQPPLWTVDDLAHYLNVPKRGVYELIKSEDIPHYRVGTRIRFDPTAIGKWVDSKKSNGTAP
jgi:excisionase family DNA binding protein